MTRAQRRTMARRACERRYGYAEEAMSAGGELRWYSYHPTEDPAHGDIVAECLAAAAEARASLRRMASRTPSLWSRDEYIDAALHHLANVNRWGPLPIP